MRRHFVEGVTPLDPGDWRRLLAIEREVAKHDVCRAEDSFERFFEAYAEVSPHDDVTIAFASKTDGDPEALGGWQTVWVHSPTMGATLRSIKKMLVNLTWGEEQHRHMRRLQDAHCAEWEDVENDDRYGPVSRGIARRLGVAHRLGFNVNISPTLMALFFLSRREGPAFERGDAERATNLAHLLQPRATRWAMQLGLAHCGRTLAPRERDVLVELLRGRTEKEGAAALGIKPSYFHQVVARLYTSFGVASRNELTSLFLQVVPPDAPVAKPVNGAITYPRVD